jgi:hypothetical protein
MGDIQSEIVKYVPEVSFNRIEIYDDDLDEHGKIVVVEYTVTKGNQSEKTKVAVKI